MPTAKPVRYIRPDQPLSDWLRQLTNRRETLWFFIWKDLKVQYQQPVFGLVWSIFQPLVYFGVILAAMRFSGTTANVSGIPYPLYLLSGLAIWNFTTSSILGAVNSIRSNAGIISKSFFPRFYLILAPVLKSTLDLLVMLLLVVVVGFYLGQPIRFSAIGIVLFAILVAWITALGWSAIAASMVVSNRHIRHAIPVILYAMIFALPVLYSIQQVENQLLQTIFEWNPIAGAMDSLRSGFRVDAPHWKLLISWSLQSIIWFAIGITLFRRMEKTLADNV